MTTFETDHCIALRGYIDRILSEMGVSCDRTHKKWQYEPKTQNNQKKEQKPLKNQSPKRLSGGLSSKKFNLFSFFSSVGDKK